MTEWEEIAEKLGLDVAVVKATAGRHTLITEKDAQDFERRQ